MTRSAISTARLWRQMSPCPVPKSTLPSFVVNTQHVQRSCRVMLACLPVLRACEVTRLDQDQTAFTAEGLVLTEVRTAQPTAFRVTAMLVRKDTLDDKYLFTAMVSVWIEKSPGCPADYGRVLRFKCRQGQHRQTVHHAGKPSCLPGIDPHRLKV